MSDTGVFLAAARNRLSLAKVAAHYKGRLASARNVERELDRLAHPRSRVDGRVRSAAATARASLVNAGDINFYELTRQDESLFDQAVRQLRSMPGAEESSPSAHGGEAAVMAITRRLMTSGQRVVMLANDGGAARVAAGMGIPVKHFGQVLQELVCAGLLSSPEAMATFDFAQEVSGVPSGVRPTDEAYFACASIDGICLRCP